MFTFNGATITVADIVALSRAGLIAYRAQQAADKKAKVVAKKRAAKKKG